MMAHVAITGAGTGLGAALAQEYAKQGNVIYLLGRTEDNLSMVQRNIEDSEGKAEVILCDVTEPGSVQKAVERIDRLDVLINNAGVGIFGPVQELDSTDITLMMNTNIKGTIYMTQSVLPLIQQNGGRILNIISTAGLKGKVNESAYCASKFAQRGFTESLQKELEDTNVNVTAVYMGGMNTPFWDDSDHIDNPSRLKDPMNVAQYILEHDDGRAEIHINK